MTPLPKAAIALSGLRHGAFIGLAVLCAHLFDQIGPLDRVEARLSAALILFVPVVVMPGLLAGTHLLRLWVFRRAGETGEQARCRAARLDAWLSPGILAVLVALDWTCLVPALAAVAAGIAVASDRREVPAGLAWPSDLVQIGGTIVVGLCATGFGVWRVQSGELAPYGLVFVGIGVTWLWLIALLAWRRPPTPPDASIF